MVVSRLQVPDAVDFGTVRIGEPARATLAIENVGTGDAVVTLVATDPFVVAPTGLEVEPGERAKVTVVATPMEYAGIEGPVKVFSRLEQLEVPLRLEVHRDWDGDGHDAAGAGGEDCDDDDPEVNPDATEVCDEVDRDCSGDPLDADPAPVWYLDGDADGYGDGNSEPYTGCEPPAGYVEDGTDCDDTNPGVYPNAPEVWYDDVDQDCSGGSDHDADGDGYDNAGTGGDDCVDTSAAIYPGAEDTCYDGVDQDCSGGSDYDCDGDGAEAEPWGDDCADADPAVGPDEAEADDGVDQDCDGMIDEDYVLIGDLVVTEVMVEPSKVDPERGQYVEVLNTSDRLVALDGYRVGNDGSEGTLPPLLLDAQHVAVLCADEDPAINGGVVCDGQLPVALRADDGVWLEGELVLDAVDWTGWAPTAGASWELGADVLSPTANDLPESWCLAVAPYGAGDLGTPGLIDPPCGG